MHIGVYYGSVVLLGNKIILLKIKHEWIDYTIILSNFRMNYHKEAVNLSHLYFIPNTSCYKLKLHKE